MSLSKLQEEVRLLQEEIVALRAQVQSLQRLPFDFRLEGSMQMGSGDTGFRMDREGMWMGKNRLNDITSVTPIPGTAILSNGDVYAKGGYTGTFTEMGGGSISFLRGICIG